MKKIFLFRCCEYRGPWPADEAYRDQCAKRKPIGTKIPRTLVRGFLLTAGVLIAVISSCASEGINYRPLAGYEQRGKHTCDVTKELFVPTGESSAVDYGVKTYFLCCAKCVDVFKANPDKYIRVSAFEGGGGKTGRSSAGGHGNHGGGGGGSHH